jgi:hypothetical protein
MLRLARSSQELVLLLKAGYRVVKRAGKVIILKK